MLLNRSHLAIENNLKVEKR